MIDNMKLNNIVLVGQKETHEPILRGVNKLANAVKCTIGPKGRNALIKRNGRSPLITNDGVTIAKSITLNDPCEELGASVIREASSNTNDSAGDGTTTATVLAQALMNEGVNLISAGANPMLLREGMLEALDDAKTELDRLAVPVESKEDIENIAYISSNSKEIGSLIAEAFDKVGNDGVIHIEESKSVDTEIEVSTGLQFDKGYVSPYFVTNPEKMTCEFDEPTLLLIADFKLTTPNDVLPALQASVDSGMPLLIICDSLEGTALQTVVGNTINGRLRVAVVTSPMFGQYREDLLQDIAIVANGATVFSTNTGKSVSDLRKLDSNSLEPFGLVKSVSISADRTTIVGSGDDNSYVKTAISERVNELKSRLENCTSEFDKEKLRLRIAKLSGGVGVIKVGAQTETARAELKLRVEDAVNATKSALEKGIVPGGGSALVIVQEYLSNYMYRKSFKDDDHKSGYKLVVNSLSAPLEAILANAGLSFDRVLDKINRELVFVSDEAMESKDKTQYFVVCDAYTGDVGVDTSIVDPAKVTISALQNSVSVVSSLLTTNVIITDELV